MKKKKSSVLKRIVLSYMVIIIIPIIATTIMQLSVMSTVKQGIIDKNVIGLNLLKKELDRSFIRLRQLSYSLALSNETNSFENTAIGRQNYTSFLKTQRGIYSDVDFFAIYFKDYDMFMSSTGYYVDTKSFYDVYYSEFNITYEEFCNNILNRKTSSYMFLKNAKKNESGLSYILPLDFDASLCNACVIASIPSDRYGLLIEKMEKQLNSSIIISNKNNEYFLGDENLGDINFNSLGGDSGIETAVINGKKTVLCYVASEITGWKYISGQPERVFWEKARFIKFLWIITLVLCALIGCIMIAILSKQNYMPIKSIADQLDDYALGQDENNEFVRIETAISSMLERYHDIRSYLKSQEQNLRNVFFSNFLKNEIKNLNLVYDELSCFDIAFPYQSFVIVMAEVKNNESLFGKDGASLDNLERKILIDLILSNILTELLSGQNIVVPANVDNRTVVIVNTEEGEQEINTTIRRALLKLAETVSKEFSLDLICTVSEQKIGLSSVPTCYSEAEKTMEAVRMADDDNTVVFYAEYRDKKENTTFYPIKEQQLISSIKLADKVLCEKAIEEMLNFKSESISSPARIKYRGYEIAMIMIRVFDEVNAADDEKNKIYSILEEIEKAKTLTEMTNILGRMAEEICILMSSGDKLSNERIAERAKKIVHENYNDINLSVNFISEKLSLAANYLSRAFKEQTGEGLLEYIQNVRINMAKKLLINTDFTNERISTETGFTNSNSFQRVFKKVVGITPGNYRKINRRHRN